MICFGLLNELNLNLLISKRHIILYCRNILGYSNHIFLLHSKTLMCPVCYQTYHVQCIPYDCINNVNGTFYSNMCHNCLSSNFAFNHLKDDLFHNTLNCNITNHGGLDGIFLENFVFNTFELEDGSINQADMMDCDPDLNFYNNYECIKMCKIVITLMNAHFLIKILKVHSSV